MTRRIALALALTFTTIVTFGVVAVGAQVGIFTDHKAKAAELPVAEAHPPAPPTAVVPTPTPIVITEYVYQDDPPAAPATSAVESPTPLSPTVAAPTPLPGAAPAPAAARAPAPAPPQEPEAAPPGGEQEHEGDDD